MMMSSYRILVERLRDYFNERHPDISISTDIFEHGFLRLLGYHSVPERCQFSPIHEHKEEDSFYMYLRTPYGVLVDQLVQDLQSCARDKLSQVLVEKITPSANNGFCVRLTVPYQLIKENVCKLSGHIDSILSEPSKKEAYRYWTQYLVPYGLSLSIVHLEVLIGDTQQSFPSNTLDEIWSAVVKKASASEKESPLKVLSKRIEVDKEHYPEITFSCQIGCDKTTLILTRDKIIRVLKDPIGLHQFLIEDTADEFLVPAGIHSFIKEKYHHGFKRCPEDQYEINLGYSPQAIKALAKFGIKEIRSYQSTGDVAERSRYYLYDKQNYLQALIALKENKGEPCCDERLHQLKYAIRAEKWDQLAERLDFFLNFEAKTDLKIDYLQLGFRLFDFAKEKPAEEASVKTIAIIEQAFNTLIAHKVAVTNLQKLHEALFEINLMHMNSLTAEGGDETKKSLLQEKMFIHAQQAGLPESGQLLVELCGLKFGDALKADVNQDPLAVVIELAACLKASNEKLAKLAGAPRCTRSFFSAVLKEPSAAQNAAAIESINLAKK
jgi:hypothetical protein